MAVMMGKLYVLRPADLAENKTVAAAEEIASFESGIAGIRADLTALKGRVDLLTWMVGFNVAMTVALVGKIFLAR